MHRMGVMPMPPASNTLRAASSCSAKLLRGAEIVIVCPTRNCSCTAREPPRLARSRSTATR